MRDIFLSCGCQVSRLPRTLLSTKTFQVLPNPLAMAKSRDMGHWTAEAGALGAQEPIRRSVYRRDGGMLH